MMKPNIFHTKLVTRLRNLAMEYSPLEAVLEMLRFRTH